MLVAAAITACSFLAPASVPWLSDFAEPGIVSELVHVSVHGTARV
jgi:hypothetical protein